MEDVHEFRTKDFYLACVFRALGYPLMQLERHGKNYATFIFNDPDDKSSDIISRYWDKQVSIDSRTFVDAINELKTRLYANPDER